MKINVNKYSRLVVFFQQKFIFLAALFFAATLLDVMDLTLSSDVSGQFTSYINAQMDNETASEEQGREERDQQQDQVPDRDCLFEPSLPKCTADPISGCPESFSINVNEQCIPSGGCPEGYHYIEGDESGRCYSNSQPCPEDLIMNHERRGCEDKFFACQEYPELTGCVIEKEGRNATLFQNTTLFPRFAAAFTN